MTHLAQRDNHDHVCHLCWTLFTDTNWDCQIRDHEALCPRCTLEAEQGADA